MQIMPVAQTRPIVNKVRKIHISIENLEISPRANPISIPNEMLVKRVKEVDIFMSSLF